VDAGDTATYSISGTDVDDFSINASTGLLTFTTAPNFVFESVGVSKLGAVVNVNRPVLAFIEKSSTSVPLIL
jgi:hypothetical protein